VFRNMLHLQLMIAILMVVIIRLILYIDLIFTDRMNSISTVPEGKTINTMVCFFPIYSFLISVGRSFFDINKSEYKNIEPVDIS